MQVPLGAGTSSTWGSQVAWAAVPAWQALSCGLSPEAGSLNVPVMCSCLKFVVTVIKYKLFSSFKMCPKSASLFPFLNKLFSCSVLLVYVSGFLTHSLIVMLSSRFCKEPRFLFFWREITVNSPVILFIDDDFWSFPAQRSLLQELFQFAGYAGCWGISGVIWDPVSILGCGCVYTHRTVGQDGLHEIF